MEPLPEDQTPSAELRRFRAVASVAFKVSIALVGLNAVFCLVVVAGTWAAGCGALLVGTGEDDNSGSGVPLMLAAAFAVAMVAMSRSPRLEREFEIHNVAPYEFLPMVRLTLAELVFDSMLAGALVFLGLLLAISVAHSLDLMTECPGLRLFG